MAASFCFPVLSKGGSEQLQLPRPLPLFFLAFLCLHDTEAPLPLKNGLGQDSEDLPYPAGTSST